MGSGALHTGRSRHRNGHRFFFFLLLFFLKKRYALPFRNFPAAPLLSLGEISDTPTYLILCLAL